MPGRLPDCRPCPDSDHARALAVLYRRVPEMLRPRLVAGAIGNVLVFTLAGSGMWLSKLFLVSILGSMTVPALGVYGSELFPTGGRGRANGWLSAIAIVGSTISLGIAGTLLDRGTSYGTVMALLAVGPLINAVLLLAAYPETAHVELETLAYIEWFNHRRLHSELGHIPPIEFETTYYLQLPRGASAPTPIRS